VTSVTEGGTQKLPTKVLKLLKHTDMTIHWKALEKHFLIMVWSSRQFSWRNRFRGTFVLALQLIYLDKISRVFTRNIRDSLFYNVPENFASIDGSFQPIRSENRHGDQNFHAVRS
jgi:hypothetical protein